MPCPVHRYHIDGKEIDEIPSFPPHDWAPCTSDDAWDEQDGQMHVSAMAVVALLCGVLGLGLGYLIWN